MNAFSGAGGYRACCGRANVCIFSGLILRHIYINSTGTTRDDGVKHLQKLADAGLTHLHLPTYQFGDVDDEKENWKYIDTSVLEGLSPDSAEAQARITEIQNEDGFNWGYNPVLWGVPKGSYASDLMGHIMKDTMVKAKYAIGKLRKETDGVDGSRIYLYGQGWNFGEVANNGRGVNASQFNLTATGIGSFNDRIRDATLGGSPFGHPLQQGFITGLLLQLNRVRKALLSSVNSNDGSHIVHVPSGANALSDVLLSTPVFTGDEGASGYVSAAAADGGGDFNFGGGGGDSKARGCC